jgi:hypothetical protein
MAAMDEVKLHAYVSNRKHAQEFKRRSQCTWHGSVVSRYLGNCATHPVGFKRNATPRIASLNPPSPVGARAGHHGGHLLAEKEYRRRTFDSRWEVRSSTPRASAA